MVDVANSLEENIKPVVSFHLPKHLPMFEPGMRKDPIQPTEDINQMSHARLRTTARLRAQRQPTGEVLGGRQDVGRPVERVAAVIDGAAGFGRVMDGAEILPFGGLHFGTCLCRAGWGLGEEGDDEIVDFDGEEAAEFVEPEGPVDAFRGFGKLDGDIAVDWDHGVRILGSSIVVM